MTGTPRHRDGVHGDRITHAGVAEIAEELDAVDSQHYGQQVGLSPPAPLGVKGTAAGLQQLPRNQTVHPLQEHLPADLALLALVFQVGNGWLVHTASSTVSIRLFRLTMPHRHGLVQRIPKPHR